MRDKEDLFKDVIAEIRRREKEESRSQKEKVRRATRKIDREIRGRHRQWLITIHTHSDWLARLGVEL